MSQPAAAHHLRHRHRQTAVAQILVVPVAGEHPPVDQVVAPPVRAVPAPLRPANRPHPPTCRVAATPLQPPRLIRRRRANQTALAPAWTRTRLPCNWPGMLQMMPVALRLTSLTVPRTSKIGRRSAAKSPALTSWIPAPALIRIISTAYGPPTMPVTPQILPPPTC